MALSLDSCGSCVHCGHMPANRAQRRASACANPKCSSNESKRK